VRLVVGRNIALLSKSLAALVALVRSLARMPSFMGLVKASVSIRASMIVSKHLLADETYP